jgi:hypothetical protein
MEVCIGHKMHMMLNMDVKILEQNIEELDNKMDKLDQRRWQKS